MPPSPATVADLVRLEPRAYWRAFFGESLAFKVACLYLMFEYVRPQSIWTFIDVVPYAMLCLLGGLALVMFEQDTRQQPVHGSKLILLLVFLAHIVLTIVVSRYPDAGYKQLSTMIAWIVAYILISKTVNTPQRMIFFYALFMLFSFKMSQHGFKAWLQSGFGFNRDGVTGAPGWFHNSGEVGIQMCIFLPMALYFIANGWNLWPRWKRLAMLLLPLTAIGTVVASSSRGAIVGSGAALLWMLAKSKYKFRGMIGLCAVGLVVFAVLPPEFMARFDTAGQDNTSQLRLEYWAWGWEKMKEFPLFGIGYFNWIPVYAEYLASVGIQRFPEVAHNIFIQAGSELGIPGLVLVVVIIISTFRLNARTRRMLGQAKAGYEVPKARRARGAARREEVEEPEEDETSRTLAYLSLGLDAGMIGYLVSAQFVTVLYYPYLWIALAMTVALHNVSHRYAHADAALNGRKRWAGRPTKPDVGQAATA